MKIEVFLRDSCLGGNPVFLVFGRYGNVFLFNLTCYKEPTKVVCLNIHNNLVYYGSEYWFSDTIGVL